MPAALYETKPSTLLAWPHAAGWSSQVARRAHNPKVAGSNPAPAIGRKPAHQAGFRVLGDLRIGQKTLWGNAWGNTRSQRGRFQPLHRAPVTYVRPRET